MWSSFKNIAEKAKAAAADLEGQLNESVGVETTTQKKTPAVVDDDDALNDAWADEFNLDSPLPAPQAVETFTATAPVVPVISKQQPPESHLNENKDDHPDAGWDEDNMHFEEIDMNSKAEENIGEQQAVEEAAVSHPEPEEEPQAPELITEEALEIPKIEVEEEQSKPESPVIVEEHPEKSFVAETSTETVIEEPYVEEPLKQQPLHQNEGAAEENDFEVSKSPSAEQPEPITEETPSMPESFESTSLLQPSPPQESHSSHIQEAAPTAHPKLEEQVESQNRQLKQQLAEVQERLKQREDQLINKTEQMSTIQAEFEVERQQLLEKVQSTKEEAKRRIHKAKERVEAAEERLQNAAAAQSSKAGDASQQAEIIAELRTEGEKLARKQLEMEQAVRTARGEARDLREQLEEETAAKMTAEDKNQKLEAELKSTKESLAAARRGESQAGKLESELQEAKEENERKATTILSLEQQIKELKAESKDLMAELEASRKGAVVETEREQKKMRKELNDAIADLENKLNVQEKEAAVREDALRHEVAELRKRWQDAVRRADSLSMDVQSSTAPLLRQLESTERQNRVRAAAWADLENKLRSELEETVIANEKLSKERAELKTKHSRLERMSKENEEELKAAKVSLEENTGKVKQLEDKVQEMETEGAKLKDEYAEIERLANEGVSRVRSEMTQTVVDSEERYRAQLDSLESELRQERDKRSQLETQVQELLDNAGMIVPPEVAPSPAIKESKPKRLQRSQDQAEILTGALSGIGSMEDDYDDETERDEGDDQSPSNHGLGSVAALEQLNSRLKSAKVELNALRKSLAESEKSREKMVEELRDSRNAKEKLPLFEAKVNELTAENQQQSLEIQALQEDITEVRELYRSQLNFLLEEKAATAADVNSKPSMNGNSAHGQTEEGPEETPLDDSPQQKHASGSPKDVSVNDEQ